jgi:4'-phosphopantetheinyl transferase
MAACSSSRSLPANGGIQVWTAALVDDEAVTTGRLARLDDEERLRAGQFVQPRHRMRFIQFRAFAREVLGGYLGVPAGAVRLAIGRHGKPALERRAGQPDIHFNLSHSADHCVLAARLGCPVGIDLEQLRDVPQALAIARRHFARSEADLLARLTGDARRDAFFALWTHKEAAVKALGASLAASLARLELALDPAGDPRLVGFDAGPTKSDRVWLRRLDAPPGHVAALASLRPCANIVSYAWNEVARDAAGAGRDHRDTVSAIPTARRGGAPSWIARHGAPAPSIGSCEAFDQRGGATP